MKLPFSIYFIFFYSFLCFAQSPIKHNLKYTDVSLSYLLEEIENKYKVRFSYQDNLIQNKKISIDEKNISLNHLLSKISNKVFIQFEKVNTTYYVLRNPFKTKKRVVLDTISLNQYLTKGISKNSIGNFTVLPKSLEIIAGLTEADVLETLQQLPGIVSPNETATGLVVRGGKLDQNRLLYDGMNIYHNGHFFGMLSAFNPNMIDKVTFYNKGTHPKYDERASSVIAMQTSDEIVSKPTFSFGLNGINASAKINIPISKDKLSVIASSRRSYKEIYESFTLSNIADKVFQNSIVTNNQGDLNQFYFYDYALKINYKPTQKNYFYFSLLSIKNQLEYQQNQSLPFQNSKDILNIKNNGYSIGWSKIWNTNLKQNSSLSFSKYNFNYNFVITESDNVISDFDKRNAIYDTNFNTEFSLKLKQTKIDFGYQYTFKDVSYSFLNTGNINLILDRAQNRVGTHAIFTNYSITKPDNFTINAGVRINFYPELNVMKLAPRIIFNKILHPNLTAQITFETKNQAIHKIDETVLSNLSLENELWRLADNKTFPIIISNQFSSGLNYKKNNWQIDTDFYFRKQKGITALSLGFLNPDNPNFNIGEQTIYGLDLFINKKIGPFNHWVSYSYIDAKNKYNSLNNNLYFTANNAIRHNMTFSTSYKNKGFQTAIAFHLRSGKPFTRSIIEDDKIIFKDINTENLPVYHRLDISSNYQFWLTEKKLSKITLGLSLRNLYNQKNQISKEYFGNNSPSDPIRVIDKFGLGFTPNFLVNVRW
ncbi:MAG: TonB-dependent receptor plug domain-containing protein [Flavobacteriaceae bacterium]|nr:TonB-dependent receptor plug domain-containing protein [Flavobacteriaceae bacterium]